MLAAAAALATAGGAHATTGGWVSYGGDPERTSAVADPALSPESTGLRRFWTAKLDGSIIASPLAATLSRGLTVNGMFAFVGAPSWSARTQILYAAGATSSAGVGTQALGIGPSCTIVKRWFAPSGNGTLPQPLVAGDLVVSAGGTKGDIYAVRADSRFLVWQHTTADGTWSPPIDAGGLIVVGDRSGDLYAFYPRVSTTLHMVR